MNLLRICYECAVREGNIIITGLMPRLKDDHPLGMAMLQTYCLRFLHHRLTRFLLQAQPVLFSRLAFWQQVSS